MARVIVGMSGGVDSAAAAYFLKEAGHEVIGITLRTWDADSGEVSRCCEIDDARDAARALGIPFHAFNCAQTFKEKVIAPFMEDYIRGLTPDPCVECNRFVKWERMMYYSGVLGADNIATGHYARIIKLDNGRYTVQKAGCAAKDQSYMLYRLTQQQLAKTLMPLGEMTKEEVRTAALKAGLPSARKKDSQEVCFVTDGSYADYIEKNADTEIPGEGRFVDEDGNTLGTHRGIIHYTVGQRKGLGLALGYPAYVKSILPDRNEVVISCDDALYSSTVICDRLNFMSIPSLNGGAVRSLVKIRYRHAGEYASIEEYGPDRVRITFESPIRAAAPGQSAVFYDRDGRIIGGGRIIGAS